MAATDLPWLVFTGQSTEELLACRETHRIDSLVSAFELGIQARLEAEESSITEEERVVLAVEALEREVNNGGYHQFFFNSSRQFAPMIVESLRRIGSLQAAEITERACGALALPVLSAEAVRALVVAEDAERDATLDACDREFYGLPGIASNLFRFIEENRDRIRTGKPARVLPAPPAGKAKPKTKLWVRLILSKQAGLDLDGARRLARELAQRDSLDVTEEELESAAVLYAFRCELERGDLTAAEPLAALALERSREDPSHVVFHKQWVDLLLQAGRKQEADGEILRFLEMLASRDPSELKTQNTILFWAGLLQTARADLPRSVEFFRASFPEESLDGRLAKMRFAPEPRPGRA